MFPAPPKHAIGEAMADEATTADGSEIFIVVEAVHPFPSVMVKVEFPDNTVNVPIPL